jgi:hypothetical protein
MPIPPFESTGLLPAGTYPVTLAALRESVLVVGPDENSHDISWDASWRAQLVDRARILIEQLWSVNVTQIFLDGSFVEAKPHPNDIDGYFECDPVALVRDLQPRLNEIDPYKVWTWAPGSRRPAPGSTKHQLPMWHRYRVELYPHFPGLLSGIHDAFGNELQFPAAFRQQRGTALQKGIVQIVR